MLRIVTEADIPEIQRIYTPAVTEGVTSFELEAPSAVELATRIREVTKRYPWLVDCDQTMRGFAYANYLRVRAAYQWSVEVSIYVDRDWQRSGCGRNLYGHLFDILRAQGFCSAYAGIAAQNEASRRLHESFGFQQVGLFPKVAYKRDAWHDVAWWRLDLRTTDDSPAWPTWFENWPGREQYEPA